MSRFRTSSPRTSNKIKFAVAGAALALVAAIGGTIGVLASGASASSAVGGSASSAVGGSASSAVAIQAPGTKALVISPHSAASGRPSALSRSRPAVLDAFAASATRPTPKQIAWRMLAGFHWRNWQFKYLNLLWSRESSWNVHASNPYSGAYGIPQAVPGSKMSSAGPDWENSATTQIRWGMRYIRALYRSPYWAWKHELATGWY